MQLLLIKINAVDANPEYALLGKKQKEDRFTPGDWKKVRSLMRGRRVLLIIPNDDVVLTSIKIPSKNKKQLLQAIPFALEENLAEDIEDLHFSIHQDNPENDTNVAVINRNKLESYISLLKTNGITAHFVLPQVLSQVINSDSWSLLETQIETQVKTQDDIEDSADNTNTSVSVRLNDFYGFSCDSSLLEIFIQQIENDKPKQIITNIATQDLLEELQEYPLEALDPNKIYYHSVDNALALNLLTGFISQKQKSGIDWKIWRAPLVIASLLIATWVGILGWQNTMLQKQRTQLGRSINSLFTSTFPGSRIVDPAQQMSSKLTQLKKNTGTTVSSPLPLISGISPLLKEYKDLALSEIRYKENKLQIIVESPSLTRLETFKKDAIKKSNLAVEISSSTTTADKVKATLLISPLKLSKLDLERA